MVYSKSKWIVFSLILISLSCNSHQDLSSIKLKTLAGDEIYIGSEIKNIVTMFVFISPECPACISYTKTINDISNQFPVSKLKIISVYPGNYVTNAELKKFISDYGFAHLMVIDDKLKLTSTVKAEVTPQVVILNAKGEISYSGAIDNWLYATGKKRQLITEHYAVDALKNIFAGKEPAVKFVAPFGCSIEL